MVQPGARSRIVLAILWLLLGAAMIAVPVWLGWTRWSVLLSGHPALLLLAIVCAVVGLVAVLWAAGSLILGGRLDREADAVIPRRRTPEQMRRRASIRIALAVPALLLAASLVGAVAYARPLAATPVALTALVPNEQVRVADRITWYEMSPIREDQAGDEIPPTTGLVFVPGARVDPRAYAHLLRPLAEAGFFVAVLKEPLGFSILDPDHPESVLRTHPDITYWAVGGHSLGGTTAATAADTIERVDGLVLFAAYPASRMERTDLKVVSVFGSDDGLVAPADIEKVKADLPPGTAYVEVPGAAHSWFGDYGVQPGDNPGMGDRAAAQTAMVEAARTLLTSLAPPAKK
ncbi:MAG TPA: alpha/beta hydrolase [Propionibacteriaceae bacterium]|jgi:hypothetical protein|nr:alpha/beta hydrolase [Propionibacteriaceae bacterium]